MLLRYLGTFATPFKGATSLCAGYCGVTGAELLNVPLYQKALTKKWTDVILQHRTLYEPLVNLEQVASASSLHDLDKAFALPLHSQFDSLAFVSLLLAHF